jgi:hypothetical protein
MWETTFEKMLDIMEVETEENFMNDDTIFIPQDEDGMIEIETSAILIPSLGIELHQGSFWQKYDDNEFYPDWALTSINKIGTPPSDILYYEQGGLHSTLNNFINIKGWHNINIDNLKVIIRAKNEPTPHIPPKKMKEHY